jgi:hypothetical protein
MTFSSGSNPLGWGYWKCNVSIFKDKFFQDDLIALCERFKLSNDNCYYAEWWETCKRRIKSIRLAENRRESIVCLENMINDPASDKDSVNKFKSELAQLMQYRIEGQRIRAKAQSLDTVTGTLTQWTDCYTHCTIGLTLLYFAPCQRGGGEDERGHGTSGHLRVVV